MLRLSVLPDGVLSQRTLKIFYVSLYIVTS